MTTVLVTGAAGFIGSHFVEHVLLKTDWEIVSLDSLRHKGLIERLTDSDAYLVHQGRVRHYTHDLVGPLSPILVDRIGAVDYVVNFASESHVDRSIADPVGFVKNNVDLALNMLEYARLVRPRAFVQISTDEVYGPAPVGHRHAEWSPILPSNPYSASKAAQEAICYAYWRTYGVPIIVTNTMNNYGERQDPEKFVPMVIRRVLQGEEVLVHGTPRQIGSRFYLHARNHADAVLWLLQRHPPRRVGEDGDQGAPLDRYNVVGEVELNNLELAQAIARIVGRPLRYRLVDYHSTRPGHDLRYALDGAKLQSTGWFAPVSFFSSLERTVRWTLEHPEWLELSSVRERVREELALEAQ